MPLYEEKLINPLAVRFSQDRIWPSFQDGTDVDESLKQIATVPMKGDYELVLRPPFPPIEIIRLKQERREEDGERIRDEKGRKLMGEDSWFTFDNRRLYCLQRAALQLWPRVAACVVKVLFDFPAVRCAWHKFRTTSDGLSVKVSDPEGNLGVLWCWQEHIPPSEESTAYMEKCLHRDAKSRCWKDVLTDVPPLAELDPGTRDQSVAERFNLGAVGQSGTQKTSGKSAGMTLLSLVQGGGESSGGAGGLGGLFGGQQQPQDDDEWQGGSGGGKAWQGGQGGGKGKGRGGPGAKGKGGRGQNYRGGGQAWQGDADWHGGGWGDNGWGDSNGWGGGGGGSDWGAASGGAAAGQAAAQVPFEPKGIPAKDLKLGPNFKGGGYKGKRRKPQKGWENAIYYEA